MVITETGYHRPTFEEILSGFKLKAKELWGEDIDVSDQTPLGKILNILAYYRAKDNEGAEAIYYSHFPNYATGTSLDRLCPTFGVTRNVATPARYQVEATGEDGTVIPVGFLVSTESDIEYYNTMEATITEGKATITVECTEPGTMGNVIASDITEIVNPEAGVDSVVGTALVVEGTDEESDYELRKRIATIGEGGGSGTAASIRAALLKVPTVTTAEVIENDTDETNSTGIPPHCIGCYVAGGDDYAQQIGEAIFSKKAAGIGTSGTETVIVEDGGGYSHTVKYSRMESVAIAVEIVIETTVDFEGETSVEQIKKNVAEYINSLSFGNDVVLSALYKYIYVDGVKRVSALTLNGGTDDIGISRLQYAICASVTVTEV